MNTSEQPIDSSIRKRDPIMCVAFLAWKAHPDYVGILASNRDEFFWRKSEPIHVWPTTPKIVGGKDIAGGTWLGADQTGRFALVTNVREGLPRRSKTDLYYRSRGLLLTDFLTTHRTARQWSLDVLVDDTRYRPFNLIFGDTHDCFYLTNRPAPRLVEITKGIHGLSNGGLDEPWPKVADGVNQFTSAVAADTGGPESALPYFDGLSDSQVADRARLPDTGVGAVLERRLSSRFVKLGVYGTRSSSLLRIARTGPVALTERRFGVGSRCTGQTDLRLPEAATRAP